MMRKKRWIIGILMVVLLVGCSDKNKAQKNETPEDVPVEETVVVPEKKPVEEAFEIVPFVINFDELTIDVSKPITSKDLEGLSAVELVQLKDVILRRTGSEFENPNKNDYLDHLFELDFVYLDATEVDENNLHLIESSLSSQIILIEKVAFQLAGKDFLIEYRGEGTESWFQYNEVVIMDENDEVVYSLLANYLEFYGEIIDLFKLSSTEGEEFIVLSEVAMASDPRERLFFEYKAGVFQLVLSCQLDNISLVDVTFDGISEIKGLVYYGQTSVDFGRESVFVRTEQGFVEDINATLNDAEHDLFLYEQALENEVTLENVEKLLKQCGYLGLDKRVEELMATYAYLYAETDPLEDMFTYYYYRMDGVVSNYQAAWNVFATDHSTIYLEGEYLNVSQMTADDLSADNYTINELELLKNSVLAQYGMTFSGYEVNEYFQHLPWYEGLYDDVSEYLSASDIALIEAIETHIAVKMIIDITEDPYEVFVLKLHADDLVKGYDRLIEKHLVSGADHIITVGSYIPHVYLLRSIDGMIEMIGEPLSDGYGVEESEIIGLQGHDELFLKLTLSNWGSMTGFHILKVLGDGFESYVSFASPTGAGYDVLVDSDDDGLIDSIVSERWSYDVLHYYMTRRFSITDEGFVLANTSISMNAVEQTAQVVGEDFIKLSALESAYESDEVRSLIDDRKSTDLILPEDWDQFLRDIYTDWYQFNFIIDDSGHGIGEFDDIKSRVKLTFEQKGDRPIVKRIELITE